MKLLFDARKDSPTSEDTEAVRKRAKEVEENFRDMEETDEASNDLSRRLASAQTVQTIQYKRYRRPGSKWQIEHGRIGDDYIFQSFPLKPPTTSWQDTVAGMIELQHFVLHGADHKRHAASGLAERLRGARCSRAV